MFGKEGGYTVGDVLGYWCGYRLGSGSGGGRSGGGGWEDGNGGSGGGNVWGDAKSWGDKAVGGIGREGGSLVSSHLVAVAEASAVVGLAGHDCGG